MVNIIIDYLRQKAGALTFISEAKGQAVRIDRRDGDENKSFPAVYEKGETVQLAFDAHPALVFFMLDGDVKRDSEESDTVCANLITETYKIKLYLFSRGTENTDTASFTQQAAYAIGKFITSDNSQFEEALNFEDVRITVTSFNFNKKDVWDELHDGIPYALTHQQNLCSISFDIELIGLESCFVSDPCDLPCYEWTFNTDCCYTTKSIDVDITSGIQSINHYLGGSPDFIQYWQGSNLFVAGFYTTATSTQLIIDSTDAYTGIKIKLIKFSGVCSTQQRLVKDISSGSNTFNHNLSGKPDMVQFWLNGLWLNSGFVTSVTDTQITIQSSDDYDNVSIRLLKLNKSCGESETINADLEAGENNEPHGLGGVPDFIQYWQNDSLMNGFTTEADADEIIITSPDTYAGVKIKLIKF